MNEMEPGQITHWRPSLYVVWYNHGVFAYDSWRAYEAMSGGEAVLGEREESRGAGAVKVYGIEITEAQVEYAVARMKREPFSSSSVQHALANVGVPWGDRTAMLAAGRLIQRARKSRNIKRVAGSMWKWVGM